MRISADYVDEICEGCRSDGLHFPQNAKMTIVIKEHGEEEVLKNSVEYVLQKFQDLTIDTDHCDDDAACGDCEKPQSSMEGAEGSASTPPSQNDPSDAAKPNLMPYWTKFKEDLKQEIKEDVMQEIRKEFSGKLEHLKDSCPKLEHSTEEVLHYGVYCDSCDQQIRGIRYKCGNCEDFDLCEKCESEDLQSKHDASHIFLKIRVPSCLFTMQEGSRKKIYQVPLRDADTVHDLVLYEKPEDPSAAKNVEVKDCMRAKFVRDESIPDGTSIAPNAEFIKTWRVCNSGTKPWTKNTVFRMLWSNQELKPAYSEMLAPLLNSGEEGIVSVMFTAPSTFGHYESYWEFQHLGKSFGDTFWCRIRVESAQPIEIFPLVVPNRTSALKALKLQHHQCLLKNKRKVKEEKRRKRESRKKDVKQIVDVLTAVHEDQDCCVRSIAQRKSLVTSQTATPNNTPFDLTPPKSPEPDFVEIKNEVSITTSAGEQAPEGSVNVSACAYSGDDKGSVTTLSSSDSESEFIVIPMPKCFSILNSVEDSPASVSSTSEAHQKQLNRESVSQETGVPETAENVNLVTTIQLKEDCDKKIIVSNVSLSCSPSSSSISVVDNSDESGATAALDNATVQPSEEVVSNLRAQEAENVENDSGRGSSCTFPKFPLNVESEHVEGNASAPPQEDLNDPASGMGVEVLPGNVVKNAINAAATVYKAARAVILNLQPERTDEEESGLQQGASLTPMDQLVEMGFCNRVLNEQLLRENSQDVARVVAELVNLNDNEWYASRHTGGAALSFD